MPARSVCFSHLSSVAMLAVSFWVILPPAAHAQEQQPPSCTDAHSLKNIRKQYNAVEEIQDKKIRIKDMIDAKEIYYGDAPKSFNQYANSNDHIMKVRWCQASLILSDGQSDNIYWFLADELKGTMHSTVYDHCSGKHNMMDETCATYRDHR